MLKFQNKKLVSFIGQQFSQKFQFKNAAPIKQLKYSTTFSYNTTSHQQLNHQYTNPTINIAKNLDSIEVKPLQNQQIHLFSNENNSDNQNQQNNQNLPNNNDNDNENNDNNDNNNNNNNDDSITMNEQGFLNLEAIPLKNYKATNLTEEEKQLKQEKHILFSSQQPIIPYTQVPCQLRTGNLSNIDHPLSYFLLNEDGEVYLTGIELESKVESELKKNLSDTNENTQKEATIKTQSSDITGMSVSMQISPKKMSYRVKIVEIIIDDQGIFAMTIPYKDQKPTIKQQQFNLDNEFDIIRKCIKNIKKSVSFEKIEIFEDFDIDKMNFREFSVEQLDQILFQIIQHVQKLYAQYMKENMNLIIQSLLQSRNIITRVQLVRFHLESLEDVLEIVNANFKAADQNLIRMHTQARAKMSMEYIKQNYFGKQRDMYTGPQGSAPSSGSGSGASMGPPSSQQSHQDLIKKYNDQLSLLSDIPSREKVAKEIQRFSVLDKHSSEYHKVNTYLDEVFSIPWKKYSAPYWDIEYATKKLDEQIYGLEKVKQRIVEMIAVNQLKNQGATDSKGFVILLHGPPGIGKTSIAKAVASSLKKEHRFISFAGVSDPYFMKGHRRTYVDSQPGVFVKELIKSDSMNPVFILDEIDKISKSSMGADPYYNLLEILNPDENTNFVDHYMDIKIDFSNTIFILTANDILHMLEPLKNRLEILEIPAYIEEEKLQIGKQYLIPRVLESTGINQSLIKFNDQALKSIINNWCYYESGVREFKRSFETICRKYAVEILSKYPDLVKSQSKQEENIEQQEEQNDTSVNESNEIQQQTQMKTQQNGEIIIQVKNNQAQQKQKSEEITQKESQEKQINFSNILTEEKIKQFNIEPLDLTQDNQFELLKKYLSTPPHDVELEKRNNRQFPAGTVNVLTVAGFVGHALTVECVFDNTQIDKKGNFSSSGNLKNVIKESLLIAKINAYNQLTQEQIEFANSKNYHIHFMQGGVPKDGPSAGTAITTAFLSLVLNKKIPSDLAMTGEISLNGEVCKIGGLQSKLIGSKSVNIKQILVPYSNMNECMEFPQKLLDGLTIHFVKEYNQIFQILFKDVPGEEVPGVITMKDGQIITPLVSLGSQTSYTPVQNMSISQ